MYQDKLAQLKRQVQQLKDGTLPIYMKKMKKLEQQYKERLRLNSLWVKQEMAVVQEEYKNEKEAANKEFEVSHWCGDHSGWELNSPATDWLF